MRHMLIAILGASLASGCGVVSHHNANARMQESLAAYKACLAQNPQSIAACRSQKLVYEADLRAYQARYGGAGTLTVRSEE